MQPETNHLIDLQDKTQEEKELMEKLGYKPVPDNLKGAAKKTLGNRDSVYVSKNSGGKLSNWTKSLRKAKKRRKIQKQSRKQNR